MKKSIKEAAGAIILAKSTERILFLMRNTDRYNDQWNFPGGKVEKHESVYDGLLRELSEEIKTIPPIEKVIPLDLYTSDDLHFFYHTFVVVIKDEFIPKLNYEHSGWAWCSYKKWPRPLHPAVNETLNSDIIDSKLQSLLNLFLDTQRT